MAKMVKEGRPSVQTLQSMRSAICMAQEVGPRLGRSQILLRPLSLGKKW